MSRSSISHPNGVLPGGNAFMLGEQAFEVRNRGLGPRFRTLTDEGVMDLLGFCDGESLARLGQASRTLYVFCHVENLWRDVVLLRTKGREIDFFRSWKETYALHAITERYRRQRAKLCPAETATERERETETVTGSEQVRESESESESESERAALRAQVVPVVPLMVRGLYSQFLFHQWLCTAFDFHRAIPGFFKHEDIPRVPAASLSLTEFVESFERPNKPVIITHTVDHWPALRKWCDEEAFARLCGERVMRATSAAAVLPGQFTAKDYLAYAAAAREESPLYLFDREFGEIKEIANDYDVPRYFNAEEIERERERVCNNESSPRTTQEEELTEEQTRRERERATLAEYETDLFRHLGETTRPDYKWIVIGPARSGSIFHTDPNQTNAWNVLVKGRKKWIFYPPSVSPPGVRSSADGAEVVVPVSTGEWLLTFWAFHQEARANPDPAKRPLEAVLEEGEVMFVPHGYWHMVVNLDFTIALTHNYVSTSNLSDCLRFLRDKTDQISGLHGKMHCESLYHNFVEKLEKVWGRERLQRYIDESKRSEAEGRARGQGFIAKKRKPSSHTHTHSAQHKRRSAHEEAKHSESVGEEHSSSSASEIFAAFARQKESSGESKSSGFSFGFSFADSSS